LDLSREDRKEKNKRQKANACREQTSHPSSSCKLRFATRHFWNVPLRTSSGIVESLLVYQVLLEVSTLHKHMHSGKQIRSPINRQELGPSIVPYVRSTHAGGKATIQLTISPILLRSQIAFRTETDATRPVGSLR
jgi:hypothetical protein